MRHRIRWAAALAALTVALTATIAWALAPATSTSQHFYANVTTNRAGYATVNLQTEVNPANVVVKVASGGTNLGGEDPSFATVNLDSLVNTDEDLAAEAVRVRVIGWHAVVSTGRAEFRYYSDKSARIAVDVYERTTVPPVAAAG